MSFPWLEQKRKKRRPCISKYNDVHWENDDLTAGLCNTTERQKGGENVMPERAAIHKWQGVDPSCAPL